MPRYLRDGALVARPPAGLPFRQGGRDVLAGVAPGARLLQGQRLPDLDPAEVEVVVLRLLPRHFLLLVALGAGKLRAREVELVVVDAVPLPAVRHLGRM